MSLDHAILGFLNDRPYSGYDLKKVFDSSVQHFWQADQSQIYRTLSKMREKGWTKIEIIRQESRPDRKEYQITAVGKDELYRWLTTSLPLKAQRSADMIQVFFAGNLSDEEALEIFERAAENMRMGLAHYAQIPREIEAYEEYVNSPRDFFFWMLTLDIGVHTLQSNLEFIENLIQRIHSGAIPAE